MSWRWCFYIPAILTGSVILIFTLTVPETLYFRKNGLPNNPQGSWKDNMLMVRKANASRRLKLIDFFRPFQMLLYPSVALPTACYALCFAYGSILFIITSANLFGQVYHYGPKQTGLLLGIPITVGSVIGELLAGGVSDFISEKRALARPGGQRSPEDRLLIMLPAAVLTPLGVIIEGVCLQKATPWIGVAMGIGISSAGLQIATTAVYTYTAEVSKDIPRILARIIM